ncbi:M20 aminoacylase family protein [Pandoraea apista]|uniref:Amidohydrolase n=1 Tax=Pandoraea apista TaxID=93218 RepID=A0ABX9ZV02_9BURK|nr:amidohydrolase [Pandoraea apista]RRJ32900.1 amidohydrolase [Pandoraea apista]RRJ81751.1 amidohydrolase [Pandoraea apista]RSD11131.1 amidohydrolase [Pandoraea apista]RSD24336.1 amidohydrolase [Pandoraea apista]
MPHDITEYAFPAVIEADIPADILEHDASMRALRHQIHAYPELAYEEFQTSDLVAGKLTEWGYSVTRGIGGTGLVGTLKVGDNPRSLGIRADMDALPIQEATGKAYASQHAGKMHACGHDGHTATLLAAARHLAKTRNFDGTLHLIFQPAEEGLAGAKKMIEDGLFERFPCDAVFAYHNMPGFPVGKIGFRPGPAMASSDTVIIRVHGRGGHGSMPNDSVDPVLAASHIVVALQSIVSRNVDPRRMAVVTVGAIRGGDAPNVIPDSVELRLSVRAHTPKVREQLRDRIIELVNAQATVFGARAEIDYRWRYPALINDADMTEFARLVALDWLGPQGLMEDFEPLTGSEDFSFMLEKCAGSYLIIGNGEGAGGCMVHNPHYDFNDALLPIGATYWTRLVERFLTPEHNA